MYRSQIITAVHQRKHSGKRLIWIRDAGNRNGNKIKEVPAGHAERFFSADDSDAQAVINYKMAEILHRSVYESKL